MSSNFNPAGQKGGDNIFMVLSNVYETNLESNRLQQVSGSYQLKQQQSALNEESSQMQQNNESKLKPWEKWGILGAVIAVVAVVVVAAVVVAVVSGGTAVPEEVGGIAAGAEAFVGAGEGSMDALVGAGEGSMDALVGAGEEESMDALVGAGEEESMDALAGTEGEGTTIAEDEDGLAGDATVDVGTEKEGTAIAEDEAALAGDSATDATTDSPSKFKKALSKLGKFAKASVKPATIAGGGIATGFAAFQVLNAANKGAAAHRSNKVAADQNVIKEIQTDIQNLTQTQIQSPQQVMQSAGQQFAQDMAMLTQALSITATAA